MGSRPTFSVSRAFYERLSKYCAERNIAVSKLVEQVLAGAMAVPFPAPPPGTKPVSRAPYPTPTCTVCGSIGHNARFHERNAEIEVSPELYELLSDLRIRARELDGREVTRGELLEQGIERAMRAEGRR